MGLCCFRQCLDCDFINLGMYTNMKSPAVYAHRVSYMCIYIYIYIYICACTIYYVLLLTVQLYICFFLFTLSIIIAVIPN